MKKIIYIGIFVISACGLKKKMPEPFIPDLIVQDNYLPAKDNARLVIVSADLNKDILTLIVKYGGGCKEHYFKLFTSGLFEKKSPPRLKLFLEHDFNQDFCKKRVQDTLIFNVENGKYPGQDEKFKVEFELNQFSDIIQYKY